MPCLPPSSDLGLEDEMPPNAKQEIQHAHGLPKALLAASFSGA